MTSLMTTILEITANEFAEYKEGSEKLKPTRSSTQLI